MEASMLEMLNELAKNGYNEAANEKFANYLMGKAELKDVQNIIAPARYCSYGKYLKTIGREVHADKTLLPVLGRFLRLLVCAYTKSNYSNVDSIINDISKCGITYEEIYMGGGIGAEQLIIDILRNIIENHYQFKKAKAFGYKSFEILFSDLYSKYPQAFEEIANKGYNASYYMFARIYLYTRNPNKYKSYEGSIAACGMAVINMLVSKDAPKAEAFSAIKAEKAFSSNPYVSVLEKLYKLPNDTYKLENRDKYFAVRIFYLAMLLSPQEDEMLNVISYILVYVKNSNAIRGLWHSLELIGFEDQSGLVINEVFNYCEKCADAGLMPKQQIFDFFCENGVRNRHLGDLRAKILAMADRYEDEAVEAVKKYSIVYIASNFWKKGKYLELKEKFEKRMISTLSSDNDTPAEKMALSYIKGEEVQLENLPVYDMANNNGYYMLYMDTAFLYPYSEVAQRFMNYCVHAENNRCVDVVLENVQEYFSDEVLEKTVESLKNVSDKIISQLINIYVDEYSEGNKVWQFRCINKFSDNPFLEKIFCNLSAKGRGVALEIIYKNDKNYNPDFLIACLGDSSKVVREMAIAHLSTKKELRDKIEPLVQHKKKAIRESAEKIIMEYNAVGVDVADGDFNVLAYCIQNMPSNAPKTIAWTEFDTLPKVRMADSDVLADDRILQYYIYTLTSKKEMVLAPAASLIRNSLNKMDLGIFGSELYNVWMKNGAEAKNRGILVIACIDATDSFITKLRSQISAWADAARGALASEAVRAMALNGGNLALMTVDAISKKFNNKQVKRAGEEAFLFAAEQLGIEPEVLADKIVPNLGFDSMGEQIFDYGKRHFIVSITPDLQLEIKTAEGKTVKSLPAVGVNDDQEKAKAAKDAFSAMKKNLKNVVSMQALRLEHALSVNRTWKKDKWAELFVENPIMNMFAIGLVWGVYDEKGEIENSFRYMEDGTFTTVDEDEMVLEEDMSVGLCHPLDLGAEVTTAWKEQLSDYEIKQPIEQLERKVFKINDSNKSKKSLEDFSGAEMYAVSLLGKLQKLGWYKGSVQDAGGYYNFYKEDIKHGIGVQLFFSGTYVGVDPTEEVTVYNAVFYKAGTVQYGSYCYDEIKDEDALELSEIPPRLYSEICYDLERVTSSRIGTNYNWKTDKR